MGRNETRVTRLEQRVDSGGCGAGPCLKCTLAAFHSHERADVRQHCDGDPVNSLPSLLQKFWRVRNARPDGIATERADVAS